MYYPIPEFEGPFCELFPEFINYRRSLGYDYGAGPIGQCMRLNRFFLARNHGSSTINEDDFLVWTASREGEAESTRTNRILLFNNFAEFLISKGHEVFVATDVKVSYESDFVPYIYTDADMAAIFAAADSLPQSRKRIFNREAMVPVLVRLFYSTGMRVSEVTKLQIRDVDLTRPSVTVIRGKNRKDRLVMLSTSMAGILGDYIERYPADGDAYVFRGKNGKRIDKQTIRKWHLEVMEAAGVRTETGSYPRTHDYRHGFILRALAQMEERGFDIYTTLPLLSCYVGHCGPKETEYYIRLTDKGREHIMGAMDIYAPGIVPSIKEADDDN
jgi:integrase